MPYIKSISIRGSVKGCLKYIADPDKTEGQFYLSGMNCSEDISVAEQEFCLTYENYSHRDFHAKLSNNGKSPVKTFHLIQSFKAGECDAEIAHKIGLEWVQKAFGENYQAVLATHTDHSHIHNHVCLCPYDLNGRKFNSNKKSLEAIRRISDEICRSYGIGEMEKLMDEEHHIHVGVTYGEWKHRKLDTSWKEILRSRIDMLVRSVPDFESLLKELEMQGCIVKHGKYISVKLPEQQKAVRLKTLGADYAEGNLRRRIQEHLDLLPKTRTLSEIITEVMAEFSQQTRKYSFAQSVQDSTAVLTNQLAIVNSERIASASQVKDRLAYLEKQEQNECMCQKIAAYKGILEICSNEDYISKLVRITREKMSEQEKMKLKVLESETFELYYPKSREYLPFSKLSDIPNIDDYFKGGDGSWLDAEGDNIAEQLESLCRKRADIGIGVMIVVNKQDGQSAYFVDEIGFKQIPNFMKSRSEQMKLQQEERQKQTAVRKKSRSR